MPANESSPRVYPTDSFHGKVTNNRNNYSLEDYLQKIKKQLLLHRLRIRKTYIKNFIF